MAEIALGLALLGTAASIKGGIDAKKDAKKLQRNQEKQAKVQARFDLIKRQRAARLRTAQLQASGAASGAGGSLFRGGDLAIQTNLDAQGSLSSAQLSGQIEQFNIQRSNTVSQANTQIGQAIGSFAATAFTPIGDSGQSLFDRVVG